LAQQQKIHSIGDFWQNVQFGGGVGLGFGSNYTDISLALLFIISMNIALGLELNTYLKTKKITPTSMVAVL
jgi:hypothetical protein